MSLLVWLPLLGNLNNQGISDVSFSYVNNNGKLSANNNGKIGKCYERTASAYSDLFRSSINFTLSGDITMACWAYVSATIGDTANGLITNHNHSNNTGVGITVKQVSDSDYRISCNTGNGSSRTFMSYYGTTNIKDKWCHLALTYNKLSKVLKLWVNGLVEYTLTGYENASASSPFDLFNWSTTWSDNSNYRPVCKLNDVRLYDNELSPREIKELSKGLLIHYPLNDQYIENTSNVVPVTRFPSQSSPSGWGGHSAIVVDYDSTNDPIPTDSLGEIQCTYTSGGGGFGIRFDNRTIKPSTTYCYSAYIKTSDNFSTQTANFLYRYEYTGTPSSPGTKITEAGVYSADRRQYLGNGWYRCWGVFTSSSTTNSVQLYFYAYPNSNVNYWVGCWSLEEGKDHITPYVLGTRNESTVYDTSGYGYNANKDGEVNGIRTYSDSIKYSNCTFFIKSSGIFGNPSITFSEYTISFWAKHSAIGKMVFGSNRSTSSTNSDWYWYGDNSFKYPGGEYYYQHNAGSAESLLNKWTHFVAVYNGSNITIYRNGVNEGSKETTGTMTLTYVSVGHGFSSSSYLEDSHISDFRIYVTALSENDVKDLYNNSASIDNKGNCYAYEFIEV